MALTQVPIELSSTPGIVDNSNATAITIDSSENVLVGKTALNTNTTGLQFESDGYLSACRSGGNVFLVNRKSSDGAIITLQKDGSTVGSIGTYSGTLAINSVNTGIMLDDTNNVLRPTNASGGSRDAIISLGTSSQRFKDLYLSGLASMTGLEPGIVTIGSGSYFKGNATNGYRFNNAADTSNLMILRDNGDLLVGKTSNTFSTSGFVANANGMSATRSGGACVQINRTSSDGSIQEFYKDGSIVGIIGSQTLAGNSELFIGNGGNIGLGFEQTGVDRVFPCSGSTGAEQDGSIDLGASSARFREIYATNNTINTSDRNEKQDIAELDEAERRVAVACKGLLRKFRWISSVEEKGDDARIHFGIIAQDLQAAFEAEGLDAGRYAMFISSTWTDQDGNEQTRLGVRYSQLLAFIISAI